MPTRARQSLALILTSALIAAPLVLLPASMAQADDETLTTSESSAAEEDAPAVDAPAEETPAEEAPADEAPAETPAEEAPAADDPVAGEPAAETPDVETPTAEAPADETTTPAPTEKQRKRAAAAAVAATVPTAPRNFRAVHDRGFTYFAWDAPADMGSAPLTNYVLEYAETSDGIWYELEYPTATRSLLYQWTGLIDFRVTAVTAAGRGAPSTIDSVTQSTQFGPSKPTGVTASRTSTSLDISWTAPASSGSYPLTGYSLRYREASASSWSTVEVATTSFRVDGLQPGTTYVVQVRSNSSLGSSRWTDAQSFTTLGVPSVITDLAATRGDEEVDLEWSAPASNGSDITAYELRYSTGEDVFTVELGDVTSTTVTSLENGVEYSFEIRAINGIGAGEWSAAETATPAGAPGTIVDFAATPVTDGTMLAWAAPIEDGGSSISGYEVEYRLAGSIDEYVTVETTEPTTTITGLGNNVTYEVHVRAESEVGFGVWSDEGTFTAGNVPSAPRDVALRGGDSSITVSWSTPEFQGGTTITDYEVIVADATTAEIVSTTTVTGTSTTITGLTNSTLYEVRVRALNGRVVGAASSADTIYAYTFVAAFTNADGSEITSVRPGDTILISGSGTIPDAGVFVELHSDPIALGNTTVDAAGAFSLSVTIPKNAPAGKHTLYAGLGMGGGLIAEAELAITVAAVPAAGSDGSLAITGLDVDSIYLSLWLALAAAVLGTTLLVTRRRRSVR